MSILHLQLELKLFEGNANATVNNFPPYCIELGTDINTIKQVWLNMCLHQEQAMSRPLIQASANEPGCIIKKVTQGCTATLRRKMYGRSVHAAVSGSLSSQGLEFQNLL